MLQARTAAYDLQSLLPMNRSYDHEHHLDQEDVDMVNDLVAHIERIRSSRQPRIGDRVVYISKDGDWYGNALIEKFKGGALALPRSVYPFHLEIAARHRLLGQRRTVYKHRKRRAAIRGLDGGLL